MMIQCFSRIILSLHREHDDNKVYHCCADARQAGGKNERSPVYWMDATWLADPRRKHERPLSHRSYNTSNTNELSMKSDF